MMFGFIIHIRTQTDRRISCRILLLTNYFIRSSKRSRTEDASNRVDDCAKGAALMTGTRVEIELVTSNQEMKVNRPLAEAFYQAMTETSLPEYTKEELQFAETITKKRD